MPPACSFLGIANPTPPEIQPFRFFDLPNEIRYMVYEQLRDRDVIVTIPDLELPKCVSQESTRVLTCFHPAMLRVNKQFATEYAAIAMPHLMLLTDWGTYNHEEAPEEVQTGEAQPPVLPERLVARFQCLTLRFSMDAPIPHCNVQAAIRALTRRMNGLRLLVFITAYDIDPVLEETRMMNSTEFHKHKAWKEEIIRFLQELVDDKRPLWSAVAKFHITCSLYCLLDPSAEDEPVSELVFAICDLPEEDTFELDGLHLKFVSTDRLRIELKSLGDCNVVGIISYAQD